MLSAHSGAGSRAVVQLNKKLGPPCYEAWWWGPEEASVLLI